MRITVSIFTLLFFIFITGCQNPTEAVRLPVGLPNSWKIEIQEMLVAESLTDEGIPAIDVVTWQQALVVANHLSVLAMKDTAHDGHSVDRAWELATYYFDLAQSINPNEAEIGFSAGSAYHNQAEYLIRFGVDSAVAVLSRTHDQFRRAHEIDPTRHDILNNWGLAFATEAKFFKFSNTARARELWAESRDRYALALQIEPKKHGSYNNWGSTLVDEAKTFADSDLAQARVLWADSRAKFLEALKIKPNKFNALSNIGASYAIEAEYVARGGSLGEAQELWKLAVRSYRKSLGINPDFRDSRFSLGVTYLDQSEAVVGHDLALARRLWSQASTQFSKALLLDKGDWSSAVAWARLYELEGKNSKDLSVPQQIGIWERAIGKSREAISIGPKFPSGYIILANSLDASARILLVNGDKVKAVAQWDESSLMYAKAFELKPSNLAAQNWCIMLRIRADMINRTEAKPGLELWAELRKKAHQLGEAIPDNYKLAYYEGLSSIDEIDGTSGRSKDEKIRLLVQAETCFERAAVLNPSAQMLGAIGDCSLRKSKIIAPQNREQAVLLLLDAVEKFQQARRLLPSSHYLANKTFLAYELLSSATAEDSLSETKRYQDLAEKTAKEVRALKPGN